MEQIITAQTVTEETSVHGTYEHFRETLQTELRKNMEGFIKIGYLLKVARDTDILHKSGYKSVTEFAAAEYGLTKDVVSRYIAINDRYSENGYGESLKEEYSRFGVAKLAEMLTLSDEVIESLSPQLTRTEIQEIKKEIKQEEKITDLEVMMESLQPTERPLFDTLAEDALYQYLKENKEEFKKIFEVLEKGGKYEEITEKFLDIIAPSGVAAKTTRIPGKGKIMISVRGIDENVDFLNVRNNEKESHDWKMIAIFLDEMLSFTEHSTNAEETYKELYGESFNIQEETPELLDETKEKPEVAPVQQAENKNIVTTETENKDIATKAAEESNAEPAKESREPEVEKVTGEVVEETRNLEEIREKLALAFIKRYETRLEDSENMRDEVLAILDKVHKSEWIFEHNGEDIFVIEVAGGLKLRQKGEEIAAFEWGEFYKLMHKVYWRNAENYIEPIMEENTESCTGATEEQVQGQTAIENYPEYLPENAKSNMEVWQEIKAQVKTRMESIARAIEEDNYTLIKWDAKKLAELMEAIR
ncbi:MAG: hypothetical protein IJF03_09970 [Lachnospiraceae bacterium]|nr:hypothetical protein [Lachnospiraceae bacterium]